MYVYLVCICIGVICGVGYCIETLMNDCCQVILTLAINNDRLAKKANFNIIYEPTTTTTAAIGNGC